MIILVLLPTYFILGVVVLVLLVLAIRVLVVKPTAPDPAQEDWPAQTGLDRSDPRYWKLGFYMNSQDPGLFVPKRNPALGGTINIGHPRGRVVAASMLLGIALFILLIGVLVLVPVLPLLH